MLIFISHIWISTHILCANLRNIFLRISYIKAMASRTVEFSWVKREKKRTQFGSMRCCLRSELFDSHVRIDEGKKNYMNCGEWTCSRSTKQILMSNICVALNCARSFELFPDDIISTGFVVVVLLIMHMEFF